MLLVPVELIIEAGGADEGAEAGRTELANNVRFRPKMKKTVNDWSSTAAGTRKQEHVGATSDPA